MNTTWLAETFNQALEPGDMELPDPGFDPEDGAA